MQIASWIFCVLMLFACGCATTSAPAALPSCELYVVLDERDVADGAECAGIRDGSACLTLGADPVRLQMRDLRLSEDALCWPGVAFSITELEREACNEFARRARPGSTFVLVHDGRPFERFGFGGTTPSTPPSLTITPSTGHWTAHEAEQQRLRLLGEGGE